MNASFVIVNYNRREELLITLAKTQNLIKDSKANYEIVVVDNGSTDQSAEAVSANFPDVVLIAKKNNIGAPAWNEGFAIAKGDYFIIIDDDSHVESGLDEALEYMEQRPQIGVLALNVLTGPYTSAGWNMTEDRNIIGFIGCGAVLRRETFEKIGGYADWIFLYVNEWEYGLRCLKYGYTVQFYENCKVIHRTSALHRSTKRLITLVTKHELGIVYKYFPKQRWRYILRIFLNNVKVIKGGAFKEAWWTIQGATQFLKMKSKLPYTPVSVEAQQQYIKIFHKTQESAFEFIKKRFRKSANPIIEQNIEISR
jgi:GT2 family glycosyltransferase